MISVKVPMQVVEELVDVEVSKDSLCLPNPGLEMKFEGRSFPIGQMQFFPTNQFYERTKILFMQFHFQQISKYESITIFLPNKYAVAITPISTHMILNKSKLMIWIESVFELIEMFVLTTLNIDAWQKLFLQRSLVLAHHMAKCVFIHFGNSVSAFKSQVPFHWSQS